MEDKLSIRIESARIASHMKGDYLQNFKKVYKSILADLELPEKGRINEMYDNLMENIADMRKLREQSITSSSEIVEQLKNVKRKEVQPETVVEGTPI